MNKPILLTLIAGDVGVMGICFVLLWSRMTPHGESHTPRSMPATIHSVNTPVPSPAGVTSPQAPASSPASTSTVPVTRKILFAYPNPRAKQVMIRASFTGWKPEPMTPDAHQVWSYRAVLSPGEYQYCFTVDGKTIHDPANKKTKEFENNIVSILTVMPPSVSRP